MPEEKKEGSAAVGSPNLIDSQPTDPNLGAGEGKSEAPKTPDYETGKEDKGTVPESDYKELETKLGTQGNELGELREFYDKISPMLDKLDSQPDLVKAIMNDKISSELVESVLEGKVSTKEAETVSEAHKKVKKELGKSDYAKASPEDIEKLVADKVEEGIGKAKKEFDKGLSSVKEDRDADKFEGQLTSFIEKTPDFADYAEGVQKWFDENPSQYDIKVAYDVVKGRALAAKAEKDDQEADGEAAKDAAGNAGPGGSTKAGVISDEKVIDSLIASKSNPNTM